MEAQQQINESQSCLCHISHNIDIIKLQKQNKMLKEQLTAINQQLSQLLRKGSPPKRKNEHISLNGNDYNEPLQAELKNAYKTIYILRQEVQGLKKRVSHFNTDRINYLENEIVQLQNQLLQAQKNDKLLRHYKNLYDRFIKENTAEGSKSNRIQYLLDENRQLREQIQIQDKEFKAKQNLPRSQIYQLKRYSSDKSELVKEYSDNRDVQIKEQLNQLKGFYQAEVDRLEIKLKTLQYENIKLHEQIQYLRNLRERKVPYFNKQRNNTNPDNHEVSFNSKQNLQEKYIIDESEDSQVIEEQLPSEDENETIFAIKLQQKQTLNKVHSLSVDKQVDQGGKINQSRVNKSRASSHNLIKT